MIGILTGPLRLVLIGIVLGYLARLLIGPPETKSTPRTFSQPMTEPSVDEEEFTDLPII